MQPYYVPILLMFVIIFIVSRKRKSVIAQKIVKKRNSEEINTMIELAKKFIGKECLIYSFDNSHQFDGIIKEVSDGAVLIEKNGETEAINLDFVIRIREYPRNKSGKKKSVVID